MTHEDWLAEAVSRFGPDKMDWRFICPSCKHVASVKDWQDAGAPEGAIAFSCIGRYTGAGGKKTFRGAGGPCDYAGGGLFGLNPVDVSLNGEVLWLFAFADQYQKKDHGEG